VITKKSHGSHVDGRGPAVKSTGGRVGLERELSQGAGDRVRANILRGGLAGWLKRLIHRHGRAGNDASDVAGPAGHGNSLPRTSLVCCMPIRDNWYEFTILPTISPDFCQLARVHMTFASTPPGLSPIGECLIGESLIGEIRVPRVQTW
jgi:hypothetical protein